jgi:hypothetical protein
MVRPITTTTAASTGKVVLKELRLWCKATSLHVRQR